MCLKGRNCIGFHRQNWHTTFVKSSTPFFIAHQLFTLLALIVDDDVGCQPLSIPSLTVISEYKMLNLWSSFETFSAFINASKS